jgi:hypothetical protein
MRLLNDPAGARKILEEAIGARRNASPRRSRQQAAAERLVAAVAALLESGDVDPADRVAFEDARAAAERYRQS